MRYAVLLLVAAAAVLVGRNMPAEDPGIGVEIMANEHACRIQAPLGMRSYPITKLGELRGCLYVDEVDPDHHRVVRRVTM